MSKKSLRKKIAQQNAVIVALSIELAERCECPEVVFGNDFYKADGSGRAFPPCWCDIQWTRDYYGEMDSNCNKDDCSQCWENYMRDMCSASPRKPKWSKERKQLRKEGKGCTELSFDFGAIEDKLLTKYFVDNPQK